MENVYNNYRAIVERACSAGIITEENKEFYLSAIDEENDSNLSELETILSTQEVTNPNVFLKMKYGHSSLMKSNSTKNADDKVKEMSKSNHQKYVHDFLSEDSIENCSTLDIKQPKPKEVNSQETDSDISTDRERKLDSKFIELNTATLLSRILKKPIKNQRIDFGVPVYADIEKKSVKSHSAEFQSSSQNSISIGCCRKENAKHQEFDQSKNIKIPLSSSDFSDSKIDRNATSIHSNTCICPNTSKNQTSHPHIGTNKIIKRKKSVHTSSGLQETSNVRKINTAITSMNEADTLNLNQCSCVYQNCAINSNRRIKAPKSVIVEDGKYKVKLKKPTRHGIHQHSSNSKIPTKVFLDVHNVKNKYKMCDCALKTMNHASDSVSSLETAGGDKVSFPDMTSNRKLQDGDKLLNVNIICQFYPDEESINKSNINARSNNAKHTRETKEESLITKDATDAVTDNWENKQSKKMHRLSRIFTNMKISRKQKSKNMP